MGVKINGGNALKKMIKNLHAQQKGQVDAGFFKEAVYPDGTQVAQVAIDNEFGIIDDNGKNVVPPRPFMKETEKNRSKWVEKLGIIFANQKGNIDVNKALRAIGQVMAGDIKKTIKNANDLFVANALSTIKRKGKNTVLRDTLMMLQSVNSRVKE